jgi:arylsulfatase A-like enzyme
LVVGGACIGAWVGLFARAGQAEQLPNFVVIFCDDLGYGDLACFGHPSIATPHLDRLAAEGQKWTNFYVGASVSTPSRAALLTGRLPIRNGMMSSQRRVLFPDSAGGLPAKELTLAEHLKSLGYATAAVGKWHLGHLPQFLPRQHGFDSYWGVPYSNDMDQQAGGPNYGAQSREDPHYQPTAEQYHVPILADERVVERPADQTTLTRRYAQRALDFIERSRDRPFFLYLAHNQPHIPLFASDEFATTSRRGRYGDVLEEIDAGVGQIVDKLRALGLAERTLVVFTSDNGPWLPFATHGGSAGLLRDGKGTTFEGGMRVPAIFWQPGAIPAGVQRELGSTLDLLPTFSAMARGSLPADVMLDGYNLAPVLRGETPVSPRREMYYWREGELYAVRQGPWKAHFITQGCYGRGPEKQQQEVPELYHLDQDPGEQYDVADRHPEVVQRLLRLAEAHRAGVQPVDNQLEKRMVKLAQPASQ